MTRFLYFFKGIPPFFLLSLLSGVLIGTSYIPFNGWALAFCYIPLWISAVKLQHDSGTFKKVFFAGWITQFVLTLIGFNWIYYVAREFGHLHWSLSLAALLLFAAFMHIYIPLSLVGGLWLIKRFNIEATYVQFLLFALVLALLERVWPSIFEWNLAYTLLWIKFPLFQWADTVGFWGLSTWLLIFQAGFAYALMEYKNSKLRSLSITFLIFIIVAVLSAIGSVKGKAWSLKSMGAHDNVKIAVVQGNIGNAEKVQSEKKYQYHSYIRSVYTQLTTQHLAQHPTDVMIWPETAMPFGLDVYFHSRIEQKSLLNSIKQWGIPVITGGYSIDIKKQDHLGYPVIRNAIFYISPNKGIEDSVPALNFSAPPYFKTNLLAFGEYMPLGEQFPFLYKLLPFVGVYERGSGPVVAKVTYQLTYQSTSQSSHKEKTLKLGPQICYDSLYPGFSRGLSINGAQIIFNVTNDSWYGWWMEPYQHQIMTLARGVEVRLPLVRSTNTGISSAILADGTILANSPIDQSWTHTYDISYQQNPAPTFYTKIGYLDWIFWLLLLIALILIYKRKTLIK